MAQPEVSGTKAGSDRGPGGLTIVRAGSRADGRRGLTLAALRDRTAGAENGQPNGANGAKDVASVIAAVRADLRLPDGRIVQGVPVVITNHNAVRTDSTDPVLRASLDTINTAAGVVTVEQGGGVTTKVNGSVRADGASDQIRDIVADINAGRSGPAETKNPLVDPEDVRLVEPLAEMRALLQGGTSDDETTGTNSDRSPVVQVDDSLVARTTTASSRDGERVEPNTTSQALVHVPRDGYEGEWTSIEDLETLSRAAGERSDELRAPVLTQIAELFRGTLGRADNAFTALLERRQTETTSSEAPFWGRTNPLDAMIASVSSKPEVPITDLERIVAGLRGDEVAPDQGSEQVAVTGTITTEAEPRISAPALAFVRTMAELSARRAGAGNDGERAADNTSPAPTGPRVITLSDLYMLAKEIPTHRLGGIVGGLLADGCKFDDAASDYLRNAYEQTAGQGLGLFGSPEVVVFDGTPEPVTPQHGPAQPFVDAVTGADIATTLQQGVPMVIPVTAGGRSFEVTIAPANKREAKRAVRKARRDARRARRAQEAEIRKEKGRAWRRRQDEAIQSYHDDHDRVVREISEQWFDPKSV